MKILFASDICFSYMDFPGVGSGKRAFADVKKLFCETDFSFVNLENVFGGKEEFTPIAKGGPNLISSYDFYEYIEALSPDGIGLANNHCGDFGEEPLVKTIDFLRAKGHQVVGAGRNLAEGYEPCVFEKDGVVVKIFAVCENEYGFATEETYGGAGYRLWRVREAIKAARAEGALPIIFFHGGNERNPYPSPMKLEMYRNFVEMGAAAVIAISTPASMSTPVILLMLPNSGSPTYAIRSIASPISVGTYSVRATDITARRIDTGKRKRYLPIYPSTFFNVPGRAFCCVLAILHLRELCCIYLTVNRTALEELLVCTDADSFAIVENYDLV